MIWIILSILTASLLFVIFKLFDLYSVDRYTAVVCNYFFAASTGLLVFSIPFQQAISCNSCTLFTLILGAVFISLFNLLALVTKENGAAVSVLSNKMAFVVPVVLSVFVFNETVSVIQIIAIILGVVGLYLAVKPNQSNSQHSGNLKWPLVLFLGSGLLDFLLKIGEQYILDEWSSPTLTVGIFCSAFVIGSGYGLLNKNLQLNQKNLLWGALLGIPNFFSIYFLFEAIKSFSDQSAVIFPVNNVGIIACTSLVALIFFKEKMSKTNYAGLVFCLLAILMLVFYS